MNGVIAWFAENKVVANLLMVSIVAAGMLSLSNIKLEVFPEFSADMVSVSVVHLGASPEEVEEGVCVKIEEAIQDLEGIKRIKSTASEGVGTVTIEVVAGYDTRKVLDDVKSRVDGISTFPAETEKPVIQEVLNRRQVINVAISGKTGEKSLKRIGERVRDEIGDLKEVSQVELSVARPYEISIEVSEATLQRYQLTFDEVANAVRRSSLDLPGGSVKTKSGEISLRTKGQAYVGAEFEDIVLRSFPDGTRLKLRDVATVIDGFAETDQSARFDGEPSVLVQVFRVGDENVLVLAEAVRKYVTRTAPTLPEGVKLTTWQDDSLVLNDRLSLLLRNGRAGFFLVFLALALFLRFKLAWWVVVGMIISFFGAFWMMPQFDVSINLLSLFAFILVLGIVVDDAIVIGENIYTNMERGKTGLQGAIAGTQEVAKPVIFAVLTTCAAFSPLLNIPGNMGKFMKVIPIIVLSVLLFSLLESLLILPAHLSHLKLANKSSGWRLGRWLNSVQDRFSGWMVTFTNTTYRQVLDLALHWRYSTIAIGVGILIITIAFTASGWVKFTFMPQVEADNVVAFLSMPEGTPAEVTAEAIKKIEAKALQLQEEFSSQNKPVIQHVLATIGAQPFRLRQRMGPPIGGASASHLGEVNLQLASAEVREVTSLELAKKWRELTGVIPDAEELSFSSSLFSAGEAINIQLSGADYNELQFATEDLKTRLAQYPGVFDITDTYRSGKQEIKLKLKNEAESLGLTLSGLARQVRQAFYGEEAQRIQRGRDDIRVMVRYPESERKSLADLENMRIRVAGSEVPFSAAAEIVQGRGFSSINRTDRKRTISVTADVDLGVANSNEIVANITNSYMPELLAKYPSVSYSLEGEQSEQQEALGGLARGSLFALLMIYILLAIPFHSYSQPLIVMSAIPFGVVGAIWGHIFLGMNLTFLSMFGLVALTGVVVNDSLVMVDFVNRARAAGARLTDAIREAGVARFRPIILTSLTTFLGLTPLLLEKSLQAQFLIPMAVSLAFGVLFATLITLILVPVLYYVLEDVKMVSSRLLQSGRQKLLLTESKTG